MFTPTQLPKTKTEIQRIVKIFVDEILLHVDTVGRIDIHINQVFILGYKEEDFVRQGLAFFALCKANYFYPNLVEDSTLLAIFKYIDLNYRENKELTKVDQKCIELYLIRGYIFWKKDYHFLKEFVVNETMSVVYTAPLLVHLLLEAEADALLYLNKSLISEVYIKFAKESVIYSLRSEQQDANKAFHYSSALYYHDILNMNIKNELVDFLSKKHEKELEEINETHTSVFAALFEDYSSAYPDHESRIWYLFSEVLDRKVKSNMCLEKNFKLGPCSISEVKNTAYVCLDIYSHLLLGMLNLLQKYD